MAELEDYTIEVLEKEGKTIIPVTTTQAVMTSSGRYLEESIVEMEEVGEGEIVDISPEVEINPSIPSGAEVIACSSMRVGEKYYSMSSVEANPTLSGSETELSGIEIDGTKYKMASGGGGSTHDWELLWENATPNAEQSEITIDFENSDYSFKYFKFLYKHGYAIYEKVFKMYDKNTIYAHFEISDIASSNILISSRNVTIENTSIKIKKCYREALNGTSTTEKPLELIILSIYVSKE